MELVLNCGGQMAPTTDKLRRGIRMGGMSPDADLGTGGASYFFTRIKEADEAASDAGFIWRANVVARLDAISYAGDTFGKVDDGESGVQGRRKTGVKEWRACANRGSNETIFKNGLSLFDDLDGIVCASAAKKAAIVQIFRKHGYDRWPDGRSLDDVIRVKK